MDVSETNEWMNRLASEEQKLKALNCYRIRAKEQSKTIGNGTDKKAVDKVSAEEQYTKQIAVVQETRLAIELAIESVGDPLLEAILIRRYLNHEKIDAIALEMGYSTRMIQYKLNEALRAIALHVVAHDFT